MEPILPMLCALGDNDGGGGVLCFSLNVGDYEQVHLCRLDMSTKTLLPPPVLVDDWWSSPLCCSFLKRVEFATAPDNNDEEHVVKVLPPKRGRGEEEEEEEEDDDVCSVPPLKRSMLPLPITSNRY